MRRPVRVLLALVLCAVAAAPALAGFAGTDLFVPMAGRAAGVFPSNWFTTLWLHNPNDAPVSVDVTFLERQKNNVTSTPPGVTYALAAGETLMVENIVEDAFGKATFGALRIQCAARVVASVRVYSKESASAPLSQSFGQDFAAVPAAFAISLGESTEILGGYQTQPDATSEARFNVGCVETTGAQATVRWTARDQAGDARDSYDKVVLPLSQAQGAFKDYFPEVSLTNSRLTASVVAGGGKVICYGSMVTNDKSQPRPVQDPTTFEMLYADDLLAANLPAGVGGSGAAGQVAFWSGATALAGNNALFWDNAVGRLGIGTASPAQQLHLTGNLQLPRTAANGGAGILLMDGVRFLHGFTPGTGASNVFLGSMSGNLTMGGAVSAYGIKNTAIGAGTLAAVTTGNNDFAGGYNALHDTTSGSFNTAVGAFALFDNTEGDNNTALGSASLYSNTEGDNNTASGYYALYSNTEGTRNTAVGVSSLYENVSGSMNTATGFQSLFHNSTGTFNTATGQGSLAANTEGSHNTAAGGSSLSGNTTGVRNTGFGYAALNSNQTGEDNTALGDDSGQSIVTGSRNTFLGAGTRAAAGDLANATAIGYAAAVDASNHVRIGNGSVTQIGGQVGWSNLSDARRKTAIRPLDLGRAFVLALRPVAFTLAGGDGRTDMGFLAQDVEALLGDRYGLLGVGSDPGRTLSLRYTDLIAPLVRAVQEQQAEIGEQSRTIAAQQARIEALAARLAELERARR